MMGQFCLFFSLPLPFNPTPEFSHPRIDQNYYLCTSCVNINKIKLNILLRDLACEVWILRNIKVSLIHLKINH